jgi:hypothetical protein
VTPNVVDWQRCGDSTPHKGWRRDDRHWCLRWRMAFLRIGGARVLLLEKNHPPSTSRLVVSNRTSHGFGSDGLRRPKFEETRLTSVR